MVCKNPCSLLFGCLLFGILAVVFVVLGFATDHWVETDVDRKELSDIERQLSNTNQEMARVFHSRHKGIYRECYPDEDAYFLDNAQNVEDGDCFYVDLDDPEGVDMSSHYETRMHLQRSVLALYVLGMVAVILTLILGLVAAISKSCHVTHAASVCTFIGGLFVLIAIVLFHAQEYVEANKDGEPGEIIFHSTWSKNLLKATSAELGYSYALAWVGVILAILDGCFYILAARALRLRQLSGGDDSSSSGSSLANDRRAVIKKQSGMNAVYDNHGMTYAYPTAMPAASSFFAAEGYPQAFMQSLPAYPTMSYGKPVARSGSERSRDA